MQQTTVGKTNWKTEMRKILMGVLGLMILGAASLQPASAAVNCVPVNCHVYHGKSGPVRSCDQRCAPAPTAHGSGPPTNIQQQKNRRMN
jgi:hypothetical protein